MKEISLTRSRVVMVDDEDYEGLAQFKWYCAKNRHNYYAVRKKPRVGGKQSLIYMHRVILNTPPKYETDHKNGNGLDNRKENLRIATKPQNQYNTKKHQDNTSGFKGVSWCKHSKKWQILISINRKPIRLGLFDDKLEAARAYNEAAIKYHGEFAYLNQVDGGSNCLLY